MAAPEKIVREIELHYTATGLDQVKAKADGLAKTQDGVAKATDAVGAAEERVSKRRPTIADGQAKLQRQNEQMLLMYQQMAASNDAVARSLDEMSKAQAQAAQGSGALVQAANDNVSAMDRVSGAFKTAAKWAAEHPLIAIAGAGLAARALSSLAGSAGSALAAASVATARYATTSTAMGGAVAGASVVASRGLGVAATASTAASGAFGALGLALRSLSGPMGLILALAGGLAIGLSRASSSAEELGKSSDEVEKVTGRFEKLVELGKRAESLDVSGPFIKAFTGLGAKMGIEVDQMQAALKRASAYIGDEFEQANKLKAKMTELQQLGYSGAEPFKASAQFDAAKNNEERIRAAYKLMEELEEKGQKFAVLDLAANFFPPELVDRLRTGRSTVSQIVSDLDEAGRKTLLKQEDVQRALELSRAIEKTKQEIWELADVRGDVSKLSITIQEWYLFALNAIKSVVETIRKSIDYLAEHLTANAAWQKIIWVLEKLGVATTLTTAPVKAPEAPKEPETIGYRNTTEMYGPHQKDYQNYLKSLSQTKQANTETASSYEMLIQRTKDRIEETNLEADSVGKARDEVIKLKLAHDLERAAKASGIEVTKDMRDEWDRLGTKLANGTNRLGDSQRALESTREAQREMAGEFATFADDIVLGGQKIGDAFGSLSKSFASSSLKALLTGEGSLAGLYGTASTERGQVGGLLGGKLEFGKLLDTAGLKDAIGEGAYTGITDAFGPLLKPKTGANGQSGGFMTSPLGQGLGVAAAGASVGYASGSPLQGALAGGMAGLMTGNPLLAVAGAGAGLIGGLLGQSEAKKAAKKRLAEQLKALKEAYDEAKPQIEQLRAGFRGEATGGVESQISAASVEMLKAAKTASQGGDQATADKIAAEFTAYAARLRTEGSRRFEGILRDMGAGQGVDGVFAQAANQAQALGEDLKSFVADAKVYGTQNQARARAAAQEAALASLDVPKTLSDTQSRLKAIDGTATALNQVLQDLGMSADQAAAAIRDRTAKALDALRASFDADLDRKFNGATDRGYLNDVADLLKERTSLLADAASLGVDSTKVEAYVTAALQKVVNESELTGDAFVDLVKTFPVLSGRVVEFSAALDTAAAKAAAAARALGYQDRLFAATNDTSSLEGQLRAYDRQAARERLEEEKAGGQALADLVAAQYAERLKIEQSYYASVADAQQQALDQAKQAYASTFKTIREYVTGLTTGADSPLSPGARLVAAQADYATKLKAAQGGDRDALDGITTAAETLRTAAQAMYASGEGYQSVFDAIRGDLSKLPDQVRPEQFVVDAITAGATATVNAVQAMQAALKNAVDAGSASATATALLPGFASLTATTNGLLNLSQFKGAIGVLATVSEQQAAKAIFASIDADGDGQISKLELIRAQAGATAANTAASTGAINTSNDIASQQKAVLDSVNVFTAQTKAAVDAGNNIANAVVFYTAATRDNVASSINVLNAINSLSAVQRDQLTLLATQFTQSTVTGVAGKTISNTQISALNKIAYNTALTDGARNYGAGQYATGGWIRGPGTGTSDSISLMGSNGEFMVNALSARAAGPWLEAMNDNPGLVPAMPVPVAMPSAGGGFDVGALVAEIRALRPYLDMIGRVTKAGSDKVAAEVEANTEAVEDGNADRRKSMKAGGRTVGRGDTLAA